MAIGLDVTFATSFPRIQLETTWTWASEWASRVVTRVGTATVRNWTFVDIWKKSNHNIGRLNSQASIVASNSDNASSLNTDKTQITAGICNTISEFSVENYCDCGTKGRRDWNWWKFRFSGKFFSAGTKPKSSIPFATQRVIVFKEFFFINGKMQPQSLLRPSNLLPLISGEQDCDDFKTKVDKNVLTSMKKYIDRGVGNFQSIYSV